MNNTIKTADKLARSLFATSIVHEIQLTPKNESCFLREDNPLCPRVYIKLKLFKTFLAADVLEEWSSISSKNKTYKYYRLKKSIKQDLMNLIGKGHWSI